MSLLAMVKMLNKRYSAIWYLMPCAINNHRQRDLDVEINFDDPKPVLIAGPTASGKSALGIELARKYNGVVINADALQVYRQWQILTARPDTSETSQCPHWMYGHVDVGAPYSTGHWLRDVHKALDDAKAKRLRPIILGGTGLYFQVLTRGFAQVPEISTEVKQQADQIEQQDGKHTFAKILGTLDPKTLERIDQLNPVRTRRAWEVITQTGKALADWQDETPAPVLAEADCTLVQLVCDTHWLNERIGRRFDMMVNAGALEECQRVLDAGLWNPDHPSCKAIGAKELIGHIQNGDDLEAVIEDAKMQTRRYAKRQRTWFRSKMSDWNQLEIDRI
jgi:tRNA dimethylallyltransferase